MPMKVRSLLLVIALAGTGCADNLPQDLPSEREVSTPAKSAPEKETPRNAQRDADGEATATNSPEDSGDGTKSQQGPASAPSDPITATSNPTIETTKHEGVTFCCDWSTVRIQYDFVETAAVEELKAKVCTKFGAKASSGSCDRKNVLHGCRQVADPKGVVETIWKTGSAQAIDCLASQAKVNP